MRVFRRTRRAECSRDSRREREEVADAVETLTVTATAEVPLMFAGFGVTEHIVVAGAPLYVKVTAPEKPLAPVMLKL